MILHLDLDMVQNAVKVATPKILPEGFEKISIVIADTDGYKFVGKFFFMKANKILTSIFR